MQRLEDDIITLLESEECRHNLTEPGGVDPYMFRVSGEDASGSPFFSTLPDPGSACEYYKRHMEGARNIVMQQVTSIRIGNRSWDFTSEIPTQTVLQVPPIIWMSEAHEQILNTVKDRYRRRD